MDKKKWFHSKDNSTSELTPETPEQKRERLVREIAFLLNQQIEATLRSGLLTSEFKQRLLEKNMSEIKKRFTHADEQSVDAMLQQMRERMIEADNVRSSFQAQEAVRQKIARMEKRGIAGALRRTLVDSPNDRLLERNRLELLERRYRDSIQKVKEYDAKILDNPHHSLKDLAEESISFAMRSYIEGKNGFESSKTETENETGIMTDPALRFQGGVQNRFDGIKNFVRFVSSAPEKDPIALWEFEEPDKNIEPGLDVLKNRFIEKSRGKNQSASQEILSELMREMRDAQQDSGRRDMPHVVVTEVPQIPPVAPIDITEPQGEPEKSNIQVETQEGGRIAYASIPSEKHPNENQDAIIVLPEQRIFAVLDGVGGVKEGGRAAQIAKQYIEKKLHVLSAKTPQQFIESATRMIDEIQEQFSQAIPAEEKRPQLATHYRLLKFLRLQTVNNKQ